MRLALLALGLTVVTAAAPSPRPVQPLLVAPLAIIEGGTVSTLPKSVKARGGRVVTLGPRKDARVAAAKLKARAAKRLASPAREREAAPAPTRSCACGGGAGDAVDLRATDQLLKVMVLGPDGLTRTRYVPASPGAGTRYNQD